jgi:hypothetical protein
VVTIIYTPPFVAVNPTFIGPQPTNPSGPAPYRFNNVTVNSFETDLTVHYTTMTNCCCVGCPSLSNTSNSQDFFIVRLASGHEYDASMPLDLEQAGSAHAASLVDAEPAGGTVVRSESAAAAAVGGQWWYSEFYVGFEGALAMSTSLCQSTVSFLQGGNAFVAIRFPVSGGASVPFPLPLRYGESGHYPRLDLLNEDVTPNVAAASVPLHLMPEWMTYAATVLPQATGEQWLTVGGSSADQVSCPANLNLSTWEFYSYLPMDAGSSVQAWADKILPGYFCFVTSTPPPFLATIQEALGLELDEEAASLSVVTAMGPFAIRLLGSPPDPPYLVAGPQMAQVKSPGQAQLRFLIENKGSQSAAVTLSTTSTQQLPWQIYNGTFTAPNTGSPVSGPISISAGGAAPVWLLANVPSGASGAETVVLTASSTSPARSTWNSGLVWLGSAPNLGRTVRRHLPHK